MPINVYNSIKIDGVPFEEWAEGFLNGESGWEHPVREFTLYLRVVKVRELSSHNIHLEWSYREPGGWKEFGIYPDMSFVEALGYAHYMSVKKHVEVSERNKRNSIEAREFLRAVLRESVYGTSEIEDRE